jgi:transcriptional regulator with XRE-family HTH domain
MIEKAKIEKITVCKMTGEELKRLRIAAGLEQKELAGKMNWSRIKVAVGENRGIILKPQEMEILLGALGASSI